jgi:galactose-1-phosphate uridylyltransferase
MSRLIKCDSCNADQPPEELFIHSCLHTICQRCRQDPTGYPGCQKCHKISCDIDDLTYDHVAAMTNKLNAIHDHMTAQLAILDERTAKLHRKIESVPQICEANGSDPEPIISILKIRQTSYERLHVMLDEAIYFVKYDRMLIRIISNELKNLNNVTTRIDELQCKEIVANLPHFIDVIESFYEKLDVDNLNGEQHRMMLEQVEEREGSDIFVVA